MYAEKVCLSKHVYMYELEHFCIVITTQAIREDPDVIKI